MWWLSPTGVPAYESDSHVLVSFPRLDSKDETWPAQPVNEWVLVETPQGLYTELGQ